VGVEELIRKIEERKAAAKKDRVKSGKTNTNFGKEYNIAFLPDTDDEAGGGTVADGGGGTVADGGGGTVADGGGNEKKLVTVDDKVGKLFN
jgi:hypothetical protein